MQALSRLAGRASTLPLAALTLVAPGGLAGAANNGQAGSRALSAARGFASLGASDAVLSQLQDKGLVKTHSYIGGEWVGAQDGTTVQVSTGLPHGLGRRRTCRVT